ncbi:unnamed protein product [Didymodactylos carnosus]|nr:unnamed protein product [Didymodactylos carnosus]CAF3521364.1 unnamed protein product [Didymodactylos carnosus]
MQQSLDLSNNRQIEPVPISVIVTRTTSTGENVCESNRNEIRAFDNGIRKKYNGQAWHRLCSLATCDRYSQGNKYHLCYNHFIEQIQMKTNDDNTKENEQHYVRSVTDVITKLKRKNRKNVVEPVAKRRAKTLVDSTEHFRNNNNHVLGSKTVESNKMFERPFIFKPKSHLIKSLSISSTNTLVSKSVDAHFGNRQRTEPKFLLKQSPAPLPVCRSLSKTKRDTKHEESNNATSQGYFEGNKRNPYASYNEKKILAKKANISAITDSLINEQIKHRKTACIHQQKNKNSVKQRKTTSEIEKATIAIQTHDSHDFEKDEIPLFKRLKIRNEEIVPKQVTDRTSTFSNNDEQPDINTNSNSDNHDVEDTKSNGFEMVGWTHATSTSLTKTNIDEMISYTEQKKIFISQSNLTIEQMFKLEEFLTKFQIPNPLSEVIDDKITHLITDEIVDQPLVCTLTKNVIQAIVRHINVISYRWIIECLKQERIIDWKDFEIYGDTSISHQHYGPRTSRTNQLQNKRLFPSNFFVKLCTSGCLEMDSEELGELVWLSGGIFLHQSTFPHTVFERYCIVLVDDENIKNKHGYEDGVRKGIKFLRPRWLIDSCVQQRIQDFGKYNCIPTFKCQNLS